MSLSGGVLAGRRKVLKEGLGELLQYKQETGLGWTGESGYRSAHLKL